MGLLYELGPIDDEDVAVGLENDVVLAEVSMDNACLQIGLPHVEQNLIQHTFRVGNLQIMDEFGSFDHSHHDSVSVLVDGFGNRNAMGVNQL